MRHKERQALENKGKFIYHCHPARIIGRFYISFQFQILGGRALLPKTEISLRSSLNTTKWLARDIHPYCIYTFRIAPHVIDNSTVIENTIDSNQFFKSG